MNKLHFIFCLALTCTLFVSCDFPDYTDEINAAYFNAGGSAGNAECTYGKYRCSNGNSQFCGYSGNDLSWQLSETCSYGCDSSTGKCNTNSGGDSGDSGNSGNNSNPGNDTGDSGNNQNNDPTDTGTEEPTQSACYPNPCENLANSTGTCTTTPNGGYFCGCNDGYNWRRKECVVIPKVLGNICTGQTKCFTSNSIINCNSSSIGDFYGQDAHYAAQGTCIPQKFKIDESVSEEKTVFDENFGLEWQQATPTEQYSWDNAVTYCENLNYGGHDDWRLPTLQELLSIVDNSKYQPSIDETYFPNTPKSDFWSSYNHVNSGYAWRVDFENGVVGETGKNNKYYVRCVRGDILPNSTFEISTVNGDIVVKDLKTGLIWQKKYADYTWKSALKYCENSTYAGYTDWRLPNKNELASLVNYEEYNPASDFPDMPNYYFWSSSNYGTSTYAWLVNFFEGEVYMTSGLSHDKAYESRVRCVR